MKKNKLVERFEDAILEAYNNASNIFGITMHFYSYDDLVDCCMCKEDHSSQRVIPYMAFLLSKETLDEITKAAVKGCHYSWVWPRKINIGGDTKFNKYIKDLDKYEKEKSSLTPWFRKKRKLELAEKYDLQWRSREAESLSFEIYNVAPTLSEKYFNEMKRQYKDFLNNKEINPKYQEDIKAADAFFKNYMKKYVKP